MTQRAQSTLEVNHHANALRAKNFFFPGRALKTGHLQKFDSTAAAATAFSYFSFVVAPPGLASGLAGSSRFIPKMVFWLCQSQTP
jgi:hypothetical protein